MALREQYFCFCGTLKKDRFSNLEGKYILIHNNEVKKINTKEFQFHASSLKEIEGIIEFSQLETFTITPSYYTPL